jgi:hypothetical protein
MVEYVRVMKVEVENVSLDVISDHFSNLDLQYYTECFTPDVDPIRHSHRHQWILGVLIIHVVVAVGAKGNLFNGVCRCELLP